MGDGPQHDRIAPILTLSVLVILWRLAAAASPYREGVLASMTGDSLGVRWIMGAMGVVFVAIGLYAYARHRRHVVMIFALSACTGGLHWGGPIGLANSNLEAVLFLFYFVASSLLGQGLFLHFILVFTGTTQPIAGRKWLVLYLPAIMGILVSLGLITLPIDSAASRSLRQAFLILITVMIVYDLLALGVLIHRAVRPRPDGPSRGDLVPILAAFAIAALITFLPGFGLSLPDGNDILNVGNVLIPLAFAYVIVQRGTRRVPPNPHA